MSEDSSIAVDHRPAAPAQCAGFGDAGRNAHRSCGPVWMTKEAMWQNVDAPSLRHAMELENRTQVLGNFTGCMEEAMAAFGTGRKPSWEKL